MFFAFLNTLEKKNIHERKTNKKIEKEINFLFLNIPNPKKHKNKQFLRFSFLKKY